MGWVSVGDVARKMVARQAKVSVFDKIATLASAEEVDGWRQGVSLSGRDWEPGEKAALLARERILRGLGR